MNGVVTQFLFIIFHKRELFQVKSLTWILDRTVLVGHSRDYPNKEVVFELPTFRVYDLCQRAARRQQETDQEQVLVVDLDTGNYTYEYAVWLMESIRSKLKPDVRITVSVQC